MNHRATPGGGRDGRAGGVEGRVFDEISRINSELVNAQRDLVRRNEELLRLNAELLEARVQLEAARREAEAADEVKGRFLATMSHEIRTPMTAILGYAELLLDPTQTSEERVASAQVIRRNGEHLLALLNDILDFSKLEAGEMTVEPAEFDPRHVVEDVLSILRVRADAKGIALRAEYRSPLPDRILSDALRIRQILLNLAGNAVKFTHEGGVTIRVRREASKGASPDRLAIDVEDTGIGMSPDALERVFRPFTQADASTARRYGGTGLGLAISRGLAERLNGEITVRSESGAGTTCSLFLPITDCPGGGRGADAPDGTARVRAERTEQAADAIRLEARILLVEDSEDNLRLLTHHLERAGATVETATTGDGAVERAAASRSDGRPYDLVLLDMQLPVLDGYAAASLMRAQGYGGPIVALTANVAADDRQRCISAGCSDYATKPIDRHALLRVCARWLRR